MSASARFTRVAAAVGLAGVGLSLLGALLDPRQAAFSYLTAYAAVTGTALGALSLLMIAQVTGARWMAPMLPYARAGAAVLPLLALLFLPLVAGLHALYPWVPPLGPLSPDVREHVLGKAAYLNVPFFLVRTAVYFIVWVGLAEVLLRSSPAARGRWSAAGLIPFAFATTFAAIDWIMGLLPAWWSTIYGLYFWSGGFLAALAWLALARHFLPPPGVARSGPADDVNTLGKLLLTFLLFWVYVAFSQFLVIWIGNVPLESTWLAPRLARGWAGFSLVLLLGQFGAPFLFLLPRTNRARAERLAAAAGVVLVMHYLDVYWLVMPALSPAGFRPHWLDLAALAAVLGPVAVFGEWRARRLVPELEEEEGAAASAAAWW